MATVRALKHHGGCPKAELAREDLAALEAGLPNLLKHVENITRVYGLPAVVAINQFVSDTDAEIAMIREACGRYGVRRGPLPGLGQGRRGRRGAGPGGAAGDGGGRRITSRSPIPTRWG